MKIDWLLIENLSKYFLTWWLISLALIVVFSGLAIFIANMN